MLIQSRRAVLALASAAMAFGSLGAEAQTWPQRPVTLIVSQAAGASPDVMARLMSEVMSRSLGQGIIVENKPGGGNVIGANAAARAAPDGYTFFMGAVHHAIAPSMYPKLDYDLERDFVPLALMAVVPQVLVVNPKKIPGDYKAFLEQVRSNPGRLNFGSAGGGTSHHLAGELFKLQTKTFITHLPYRGAGPALQDLIAGNVDMMFDGLGSSAQHIKGGRIKALMVSGNKRNAAFPDVPCAAELGLPDYTVTTWYGLWTPKGTPADLQARAIEEVRKASAADDIKLAWSQNGAEFPNITGPQFGSFVNNEIKRWTAVVKASGAKLD